MRSILALIKSFFSRLWLLITARGVGPVIVDEPDDPARPEPGPGEVVCYYGCPNSKKAQRLQLNKKIYK